jgi:hypothetical protein
MPWILISEHNGPCKRPAVEKLECWNTEIFVRKFYIFETSSLPLSLSLLSLSLYLSLSLSFFLVPGLSSAATYVIKFILTKVTEKEIPPVWVWMQKRWVFTFSSWDEKLWWATFRSPQEIGGHSHPAFASLRKQSFPVVLLSKNWLPKSKWQ